MAKTTDEREERIKEIRERLAKCIKIRDTLYLRALEIDDGAEKAYIIKRKDEITREIASLLGEIDRLKAR